MPPALAREHVRLPRQNQRTPQWQCVVVEVVAGVVQRRARRRSRIGAALAQPQVGAGPLLEHEGEVFRRERRRAAPPGLQADALRAAASASCAPRARVDRGGVVARVVARPTVVPLASATPVRRSRAAPPRCGPASRRRNCARCRSAPTSRRQDVLQLRLPLDPRHRQHGRSAWAGCAATRWCAAARRAGWRPAPRRVCDAAARPGRPGRARPTSKGPAAAMMGPGRVSDRPQGANRGSCAGRTRIRRGKRSNRPSSIIAAAPPRALFGGTGR